MAYWVRSEVHCLETSWRINSRIARRVRTMVIMMGTDMSMATMIIATITIAIIAIEVTQDTVVILTVILILIARVTAATPNIVTKMNTDEW